MWHHITLLISLCVIQTDSAVVLTYCNQSIDSCCHSAVHNLCNQGNFHCIMATRLHMPLSYFGQQVIHVASLNFIQLQYNVPLSSTSQSIPTHSNLTLHICYIMFEEKALHMHLSRCGGSNIAAICRSSKLNKSVCSETPGSFVLIVGTPVTHSGYNLQSCIVTGINSLHQEINKHHTLSASVNQVVR